MSHPARNDRAETIGPLGRLATQTVVWAGVTLFAVVFEAARWLDPDRRAAALGGRLFASAEDVGPFLPVLFLAPLFWWAGSSRQTSAAPVESLPPPRKGSRLATAAVSLLVGLLAFGVSRQFGRPFDGMPPAIHDEFSYLFQAETFLAGRTWLPSSAKSPELFDQMHVLNEGRFASRYFPGTGLWIAPFLRAGNPWLGYWIANGLIAAMLVWIGRALSGLFVGTLAGLLYVAAPGVIAFSNLLVAHHPTLLGLSVFLWAILKARNSHDAWRPWAAGTGLAFAMICRPVTAAAFAFPFGVDWIVRLFSRRRDESEGAAVRPGIAQTICLGLPLVVGGALLLAYNHSITGDAFVSPYQQYTDIYTPRHVYGFNNVIRGEQHLGPKVIDHYDRWAANLTPALAAQNVLVRVLSSWRGLLGWIPMLFAALATLYSLRSLSTPWKLVAASIVSLHVAHIPYWFDGIMGWHYVFESAPLWLLLFAEMTRRLFGIWTAWGAPRMKLWWGALIATALVVNVLTIEPLWQSRWAANQAFEGFSRRRFARFRAEAAELAKNGPIIVFVEPDPTDRHIDFVTNPPSLDGPVLVARAAPGKGNLIEALQDFSNRHPYRYRATSGVWEDLGSR